jgi:hypothetical protein
VKADVDLGMKFISSQCVKKILFMPWFNYAGIDGIHLPKGTNLVINVYGLHRKTEIWGENAHLYIPERFDNENSRERHPYAFLPFASGTRLCIGKYNLLLVCG